MSRILLVLCLLLMAVAVSAGAAPLPVTEIPAAIQVAPQAKTADALQDSPSQKNSQPSKAADSKTEQADQKTWWKQREKRSDIYYPHNAHMEVMDKEGDSCMLCHPYTKTDMIDTKKTREMTVIANEALMPICHSCHVDEMRGPWRCNLCHDDKEKIWPPDHRHDYNNHHGDIAQQDEQWCKTCHLDTNFCTDCHLRRDTAGSGYHPLGYRTLHGLESRLDAGRCGRCHNEVYCSDCHMARSR